MLDWLLEEDEPSARYETLVRLLGRDEYEPSVRTARSLIGTQGWAAKLLDNQKEQTYWDNPNSCYVPKFSACSWQLIVLADLGVSSKDPRVVKAVEHFLDLHNVETVVFLYAPKVTRNLSHISARPGTWSELSRGWDTPRTTGSSMRWTG